MANEPDKEGRELTGKHVLIIVVSAFAIIIGVNLFMAFSAVGTFPGLEVKNSYVASQEFDQLRDAQEALGWDVSAEIEGDVLTLSILDPEGDPVEVLNLDGTLGRATHVNDDQTPDFSQSSTGSYVANVGQLDGGNWNLRMTATAPNGTPFQQRIVIYIAGR
ncbi:FixH family protein [Aliiroseovarius subalbicans]|uniref:FixH family protein n=1 Tax=Aliiroseovarius subalbicans TaxID=2925840 RepID=UPI001F5AEFF6|nr:FixH family protein [Aliiroseovarius subalbicans]MCI2400645.1 FixH family protein [Aliiroseovarius subalbicans]